MKSTELNLIPIFVTVCEERNLSKAATRLHLSQPAVSKAITRLRSIYGDQLFYRSSYGVEVTNYARELCKSMKTILETVDSHLVGINHFNPESSSRLFSVACPPYVSHEFIPKLINKIKKNAPNIVLQVNPLFVPDYEEALRFHQYDVIIDIERELPASVRYDVITNEELMVVCSENHPRIGSQLSLKQFLQEEHVVLTSCQNGMSSLTSSDINELSDRRVAYSASNYIELLSVVSQTEYIAILPKKTTERFAKNYGLHAFTAPFNKTNFNVCNMWHSNRSNDAGHQWLMSKIKNVASFRDYL
ncbi:LysR substrate-binding domain-containing protein [Vibrio kasasachensis]|uniref:LysR substrate-binding domain-containing protein n=1 Tax=Vibrio kasasachensis TaxID=2910248 RepID=UPI003D14552A